MLILHENDLMPRELHDKNMERLTILPLVVWMCIAKLRKYLKLDEDVEILNIHGEGFRLVVKNKVEKIKASDRDLFWSFFFIRYNLFYHPSVGISIKSFHFYLG
jgi:prephenate dehydrogenase